MSLRPSDSRRHRESALELELARVAGVGVAPLGFLNTRALMPSAPPVPIVPIEPLPPKPNDAGALRPGAPRPRRETDVKTDVQTGVTTTYRDSPRGPVRASVEVAAPVGMATVEFKGTFPGAEQPTKLLVEEMNARGTRTGASVAVSEDLVQITLYPPARVDGSAFDVFNIFGADEVDDTVEEETSWFDRLSNPWVANNPWLQGLRAHVNAKYGEMEAYMERGYERMEAVQAGYAVCAQLLPELNRASSLLKPDDSVHVLDVRNESVGDRSTYVVSCKVGKIHLDVRTTPGGNEIAVAGDGGLGDELHAFLRVAGSTEFLLVYHRSAQGDGIFDDVFYIHELVNEEQTIPRHITFQDWHAHEYDSEGTFSIGHKPPYRKMNGDPTYTRMVTKGSFPEDATQEEAARLDALLALQEQGIVPMNIKHPTFKSVADIMLGEARRVAKGAVVNYKKVLRGSWTTIVYMHNWIDGLLINALEWLGLVDWIDMFHSYLYVVTTTMGVGAYTAGYNARLAWDNRHVANDKYFGAPLARLREWYTDVPLKIYEWDSALLLVQEAWRSVYRARMLHVDEWPIEKRNRCSGSSNSTFLVDVPAWQGSKDNDLSPEEYRVARSNAAFVQLDDSYCLGLVDLLAFLENATNVQGINLLDVHPVSGDRYNDVEKLLIGLAIALLPAEAIVVDYERLVRGNELPIRGRFPLSDLMVPPVGGWPSIIDLANANYAKHWVDEHSFMKFTDPTGPLPFDPLVRDRDYSMAERETIKYQKTIERSERVAFATEVRRRNTLEREAAARKPPVYFRRIDDDVMVGDEDVLREMRTILGQQGVNLVAAFAVKSGTLLHDYFERQDGFFTPGCPVDVPLPQAASRAARVLDLEGSPPLSVAGHNEAMLFYGSSMRGLRSIARDGFEVESAKSLGRFGTAAYFADHAIRSLDYSKTLTVAEKTQLGLFAYPDLSPILMCRVSCGCTARVDDISAKNGRDTQGRAVFTKNGLIAPFDSLLYDPGQEADDENGLGLRQREYMIFDKSRAVATHLLLCGN